MKLHEKIYYLRTKNRLSQGDLAEILSVSWFTYFSTDIYMVTGTAINRTAVFSPYAYEIWGVRILVHWAYLILLLALIVWTVYIFRYIRYVITPFRRIGCLLGWITVLGIIPLMNFVFSGLIASKLSSLVEMSGGIFTVGTELYEQHEFYIRLMSCMGFVSEWIQIIALTFLIIVMVSWIHMKKKEKINSSMPFTE